MSTTFNIFTFCSDLFEKVYYSAEHLLNMILAPIGTAIYTIITDTILQPPIPPAEPTDAYNAAIKLLAEICTKIDGVFGGISLLSIIFTEAVLLILIGAFIGFVLALIDIFL